MDDPIKLRDGKLHVFKQPRCQNYYFRFFVNGKYLTRTAKTCNLALAKSTAENFYDSYRFTHVTAGGKPKHTWDEAEKGVLRSLALEDTTSTSRIRTYSVKFAILRKFFDAKPLEEINKTDTLEGYVAWRRNVYRTYVRHDTLTNKTLRRDFDVLRALLKYALRQEWIDKICAFPKLTVTPRPGGWFTQEELGRLLNLSHRWICQNDSISDEELRQRTYTDCYMKWLLYTGMRVDEALQVRFEDVAVQDPELLESLQDRCLFVQVKGGKLSYRKGTTEMIGLGPGVLAFYRLQQITSNPKPNALLFPVNPRERVQKLFEKAEVLYDERGQRRTAKSFRHTYIMRSLLANVDVYVLAKNCRTSVQMIEQYYGSYITARMKQRELTKMFARVNIEGGDE